MYFLHSRRKNAQRMCVIILLSLPPMEGAENQSQQSHLKAGLWGQTKNSVFFCLTLFLCFAKLVEYYGVAYRHLQDNKVVP